MGKKKDPSIITASRKGTYGNSTTVRTCMFFYSTYLYIALRTSNSRGYRTVRAESLLRPHKDRSPSKNTHIRTDRDLTSEFSSYDTLKEFGDFGRLNCCSGPLRVASMINIHSP